MQLNGEPCRLILSNVAGLQVVSFYLLHQGGAIQVEQLGRFVFYPLGFFQRLQDQRFFKFGNGTIEADAFI